MEVPTLVKNDNWLFPFASDIVRRIQFFKNKQEDIEENYGSLYAFATGHFSMGLHLIDDAWVLREWAPNATKIVLIGAFSDWQTKPGFQLSRQDHGIWEIRLPKTSLKHGDLYKLHVFWEDGDGLRIPAWARRVVQDDETKIFSAQVWQPEEAFEWEDENFKARFKHPLIYEAHVGMSSMEEKVSHFTEFKEKVLPRIKRLGYNTIQLMAIQEHPYYGSFGYHVSSMFAPSSRFGTPEELKDLINEAHKQGIAVIMDIVHSHAVKNEAEGLSCFDGTYYLYFHDGPKGEHPAWDSRCFNYGKEEVLQFLLSNCRYWLEEFHFDGFRFDGVTSMLYFDHGLEKNFVAYQDFFQGQEDMEALTYLTLANQLIHHIKPTAISVAEEMSGYPGIAGAIEEGGVGFDFRLSMGVPDFWIKMIKEHTDETWKMGHIYHELTQHRSEEKTITYTESHDQALVGDKTIIFRLVDKEMYDNMGKQMESLVIDRGLALHKMIRLVTLATANGGYLNFMGNEFGHPEWIDFPREGNNWSYKYARRQWQLVDDHALKFHYLNDFDADMIKLVDRNELLSKPCVALAVNDDDQVMAFSRGDYVFVFNFNPARSFTGYGIAVAEGKYKTVLTTDQPDFGGFDRVDMSHLYYSQPIEHGGDHHQILLYLPARMAMVLKRQKIRRVY
ncbi:1,4-alpha-glucan-branching enzyme [Marinilabiliaceae bacterium JC017]|nr:1,4-alpha-glucan-branching enzyme [Marinilabiliaceae bacterium JC017]